MRYLRRCIVAMLMLAGPALAQGHGPVVVELYTSQGCSSCPPADAYLHELAAQDGVVALALHVDYWDYIGWKDIFGDPAHTARQKSYAKAQGKRMVYTPQMVIDGRESIAGSKPAAVADAIAEMRGRPRPVALNLRREGGTLYISATPKGTGAGQMDVTLLRYKPRAEVAIKSGENAGRTLVYANIVTHLEPLGSWNATKPLRLSYPIKGKQPVVVLIQNAGQGPMAAAARLD
jgi:hypothetical protein